MVETTPRDEALRGLLVERRRDLQLDVQRRMRGGRADRETGAGDVIDRSDAESQRAMELALLQMHTAALVRLDEAIGRLDAGRYGFCVECRGAISERRLSALPFVVCCQDCAEQRELVEDRAMRDQRRGGLWLVPQAAGN